MEKRLPWHFSIADCQKSPSYSLFKEMYKRERGIAEGMAKGMLASIKSLVKNMNLSVEQAMSVLEIPDAERQMYRDLLNQQP